MDDQARREHEPTLLRCLEAGDLDGATLAAIGGYGPEIFEMLQVIHRSEGDASAVFARFAEELARSITTFQPGTPFRGWAYMIARTASSGDDAQGGPGAARALPEALPALVEQVLASTLSSLNGRTRTPLLDFREALPLNDQVLLLLREDHQLAWDDLARLLDDEELDGGLPARSEARLRKRFERLKSEQARYELERAIRFHFDAGHLHRAYEVAYEGYSPEIIGYLYAHHRDRADAEEVVSRFAEELWRSLAKFRWRSSFRTWAYKIATRASSRYRWQTVRRAAHEVPFPEGSSLSIFVKKTSNETFSFLQTIRRSRLLELRDALSVDDQMLLMLRFDRELPWEDLARIFYRKKAELKGKALKRATDRLRQRFHSLKKKLHEMARREGLLDSE